jgi:uncharacterized membrane protein YfcA
MLDPLVLVALAGAGLLAGFVDAIAGGGGMIALPALLAAGVPPVAALATNKLQSVIGTAAAATTYWRKGFVSLKTLAFAIACTFAAAFAGAFVVKQVDTSLLQVAVPVALIAIALYFLFAPRLTDEDRHARLRFAVFVPVMGAIIGFYDGIFGPGTGAFLVFLFVSLLGYAFLQASAKARIVNLATNLGALLVFIPQGAPLWRLGLLMGAANVAGGWVGAHTAIRKGSRFVRAVFLVVVAGLVLRLGWDVLT